MHLLSWATSTNVLALFHCVPSMNWFADTLNTIKRMYKFISIEDVESYYYADREFNNCCHVCFDDGHRTFYDSAFPVLKEMKIPATLFLSPKVVCEESNYWFQEVDYIRSHVQDIRIRERICETLGCNYAQIEGYSIFSLFKSMKLRDILRVIDFIKEKDCINACTKHNINMTRDQLIELIDSEIVTLGAHTMNHPILANESNDDAEKEIGESVEELSKILNRDVRHFAYPNGTKLDYGIREQLILRKKGIKLAFGGNRAFFDKTTDPLGVPRFGFSVSGGENTSVILSKLLLVPVWDSMRNMARGGKTEAKERKEIKNLSIF